MSDDEIRKLLKSGPQPGEVYRHYKTGHEYTIVCRSVRENDLASLVTYARDGINWTRTLVNFGHWVRYRGEMTPRFAKVQP